MARVNCEVGVTRAHPLDMGGHCVIAVYIKGTMTFLC
jgi:hypothetical protein